MSIEFYNPSLMDVLSADLQDFDSENPDDDEYEEKMQQLREETLEFEKKFPQFSATCEWCCETFSFYDSRNEMQATELNYKRFIEKLLKKHWVVQPGQWNETTEREIVKSNCFHKACHNSLLEEERRDE